LFTDMPEDEGRKLADPTRPRDARVVGPVRNQIRFLMQDLDATLPEDHQARAIWDFLDRLDLSGFYASIQAVQGGPGRPASDPQVLLALWVYATVEGVGSARKLERLCREHDAFRWLGGGVPVDYHLLSDFRREHQQALDELLTQIVATLMAQSLVTLVEVAQDGMRVRASAGQSSFRREKSLKGCLEKAQEQVERLAKEREHPDPGVTQRERAARERAAQERL
jgi:transposase